MKINPWKKGMSRWDKRSVPFLGSATIISRNFDRMRQLGRNCMHLPIPLGHTSDFDGGNVETNDRLPCGNLLSGTFKSPSVVTGAHGVPLRPRSAYEIGRKIVLMTIRCRSLFLARCL